MSKHTPGPWRYMAGTHSHYDSEGKAIARVYGPRGIDCSRRDANARLIAAAPDLLEALKGMLSRTDGQAIYNFMEPQREAARAAIAKATGENE